MQWTLCEPFPGRSPIGEALSGLQEAVSYIIFIYYVIFYYIILYCIILYIFIYLYISLYIFIYLYISLYIFIYLYISLYIFIYLYISLYIFIYLYISLYIFIYLYISLYIFMLCSSMLQNCASTWGMVLVAQSKHGSSYRVEMAQFTGTPSTQTESVSLPDISFACIANQSFSYNASVYVRLGKTSRHRQSMTNLIPQ